MEILLVVYLVSFVLTILFVFLEAKRIRYSNGDFVMGVIISVIPLVNTITAIWGLAEELPKVNWFRKPFFIQPKD